MGGIAQLAKIKISEKLLHLDLIPKRKALSCPLGSHLYKLAIRPNCPPIVPTVQSNNFVNTQTVPKKVLCIG